MTTQRLSGSDDRQIPMVKSSGAVRDDGGPAFPVRSTDERGMSLFDYFLAHAPSMPQRMREAAQAAMNKRENGRDVFDFAAYAEFEATWRMAYANAMLKAREKS